MELRHLDDADSAPALRTGFEEKLAPVRMQYVQPVIRVGSEELDDVPLRVRVDVAEVHYAADSVSGIRTSSPSAVNVAIARATAMSPFRCVARRTSRR